jgi:hypothetical protein
MSPRRTRLYEIYPAANRSGFSAQSVDYHGTIYLIAAISIKQAYYFAGNRVWADDADDPAGIVEIYTRNGRPEGWWSLWDGCHIHHGIGIRHGAGKRAISTAMHTHLAMHQ